MPTPSGSARRAATAAALAVGAVGAVVALSPGDGPDRPDAADAAAHVEVLRVEGGAVGLLKPAPDAAGGKRKTPCDVAWALRAYEQDDDGYVNEERWARYAALGAALGRLPDPDDEECLTSSHCRGPGCLDPEAAGRE